MPIAKRPQDRQALREAAFSGSCKFFFGSDSAPHYQKNKECAEGCAGVYSAPVLMPALVELFEDAGQLDKLKAFACTFGAGFYDVPVYPEEITLVRQAWTVPERYGKLVPYKAGKVMRWKMK
jgi:dihydroorotase